MKIHSNGRKLLAVLCTLAMLASLLMSFGISASAALDSQGSCGFEATDDGPKSTRAWDTAITSSNNTVRDGSDGAGTLSMTRENKPGQGQGGSDYVAVATYGDNLATAAGTISPAVSGLMRDPAAARLSTASWDTTVIDTKYRISFYYQVKSLPEGTDADIKFIVASRNWGYKDGGRDYSSFGGMVTAATITSATPTGEWIQASVDITPTTAQGLHVAVIPTDNTQRKDMEIWLDAFTISIVEQTVTFHGCGATWQDSTTSVTGKPGTTITAADVANPARDGYTFLGWSTKEGDANFIMDPVTIPEEADLDVYAIWEANDIYTANADTQTFEEAESLDGLKRNPDFRVGMHLTNNENHTRAGGQCLKIDVKRDFQTQLRRARFILRNGNLNSASDFVAETGQSYRISFWVKSEIAMKGDATAGQMDIYVAAIDPDNASDAMTYYYDTEDKVNENLGVTNGYNAIHTMQTLVIPGASLINDDTAARLSLEADTWTKVVIDIDNFAGFGGAASVVELGIGDTKASGYPTGGVTHHFMYVDDISIVKKSDLTAAADALDYQSFENMTVGTDVDVRHKGGFTAEIVDDGISYNVGKADANGKAVKITHSSNAATGVDRVQMCVPDKNGNPFHMENGKQYLISFWAYSPSSTPTVRFWVAPNETTDTYIASGKNDAKVYELDTNSPSCVALEPTVWKRYTFVTSGENVNGNTEGYMLLGICTTKVASTEVVYIDDIAVTDIEHALTKPSGNVALYTDKTTGKHTYTREKDEKEGSAFRVFGGYNYNKFDYRNTPVALIKSGACDIVGRGIILAQNGVAESDMTADKAAGATVTGGKILKNQYKTDNLGTQYWGRKMGVMTYSLKIEVTKNSAGTEVCYRPYITVSVSTYTPNATGNNNETIEEVTLYGTMSGRITLNLVAKACGVKDIGWTV